MKKPICFRMETGQLDKLNDIATSLKMTKGGLLRLITGVFIEHAKNTSPMTLSDHLIDTQKLHVETYHKGIV